MIHQTEEGVLTKLSTPCVPSIVLILAIGFLLVASSNLSQAADPGDLQADSAKHNSSSGQGVHYDDFLDDFLDVLELSPLPEESSLPEERVVCVKSRGAGMDDSVLIRIRAESELIKRELKERGIRSYQMHTSGPPPVHLIRVDGSQVYEGKVQLRPVADSLGMPCFKGVVFIESTERHFDFGSAQALAGQTEISRDHSLTDDYVTFDCDGDRALCDWITRSIPEYAAELKFIMSYPSITVVKNFRQDIRLMSPAAVVRIGRSATLPPDVVSGPRLFAESGVYHLPPCEYSELTADVFNIMYFLPSRERLPSESEVNRAFLEGGQVFFPSFHPSKIPSEFPSGDLLIVRKYSVLSEPLSFFEGKTELIAMFSDMGASRAILEGAKHKCYIETMRYLSGKGVLLVIGKNLRTAFVWD